MHLISVGYRIKQVWYNLNDLEYKLFINIVAVKFDTFLCTTTMWHVIMFSLGNGLMLQTYPVIRYFPPQLIWKSLTRVCSLFQQDPFFQRWIWGCQPKLVPVPVLIVGSIKVAVGEGPQIGPGCQDAHHSRQRHQHPSTAEGLVRGSDHNITAGPQPGSGQSWLQGTSSP